jgi:hypothetical protein
MSCGTWGKLFLKIYKHPWGKQKLPSRKFGHASLTKGSDPCANLPSTSVALNESLVQFFVYQKYFMGYNISNYIDEWSWEICHQLYLLFLE